MNIYHSVNEAKQHQTLLSYSSERQNRPLPVRPPAIGNTHNNDTLRRKKTISGTYLRSENLYDSNTTFHAESQTYREHIENHFLNIESLQIAECNNGPLVRSRKICSKGDKFNHIAVEDLVNRLNTKGFTNTDENEISDLENYIKFTLIQNLKREKDLRRLLILMKANNLSVKYVTAQEIQNIILQMPLLQITDQDGSGIFMVGFKVLLDEFCKVKYNENCAIIVEALLLQFLACIFIWMLHSNAHGTSVVELLKSITEKENRMTYQPSVQTITKILVQSILSFGRTISDDIVAKSSLRIPEWDRAIREKSTQSFIAGQFGKLSFIEQIACALLLVNTSIRRQDFDKTLRLLNSCISSLPLDKRSNDEISLLFFIDWIVTNALKWCETYVMNSNKKMEMENELLDILAKVNIDDVMNRKKSFVFHENINIRMWALKQFVLGENNNHDDFVQICHKHLEQSLVRLNLEIEPKHHTIPDLTSQPQWMETKCRLDGTFCKLKILLPSTDCLQGTTFGDYKSKADPQDTKYYMNDLDILTKLGESEEHKNIVELWVHQCIPYPLYYIICDHDSENLQLYLLRSRQERKPIQLKTLLEIILQALKAVDFIHGKGIVHRNIMAAVFSIRVGGNDDMIKLCDFKLAKVIWNEGEQPQKQYTDLQCDDIPTRWSAPESLTQGIFSRMSDSWMLFMTAAEILEHGRWPLTDDQHSSTEFVIENMLFNDGRLHDNSCIPQQICKMILDGTENKVDSRLELPKFEELLGDFIHKLPSQTANDVYQSAEQTWKIDATMPNLSKLQIDCKSVPEKGIPNPIKKYRKTNRDPEDVYFTDKCISRAEKHTACRVVTECDITWVDEPKIEYEGENLVIEEKVFYTFFQDIFPKCEHIRHDDLCITPWPPKPIATEHTNDGEFILKYTIPESSSLLESCMHRQFGHEIQDYMEPIYKLALLINSFHEAGWLINCLRAKNVRNTADGKVIIPRIGRMVYNNNTSFHQDHIKHTVPPDMKHWMPYETIENHIISKHSDVYSFGMLVSELCAILAAFGPRYEDEIYDDVGDDTKEIFIESELNCVPFGHVHCDQLSRHLKEGHIPKRHPNCPEWLYDIIKKCWEFQRLDRPTMAEIITDLQPFVKNYSEIKKPLLRKTPVRRNTVPLPFNRTEQLQYVSVKRKTAPLECVQQRVGDNALGNLQQQQTFDYQHNPNISYSHSSAKSASTSDLANISEPPEVKVDSHAFKRIHGTDGSSTTSSRSGRIRLKKKLHKSISTIYN